MRRDRLTVAVRRSRGLFQTPAQAVPPALVAPPVRDHLGVTDPTCALSGCEKTVAPSGEFVAGGHGKDACFGDSGGPVYLGDALIGVVSRGMSSNNKPCGDGGIFVRADTVVGWIEQVTRRKLVRATCDKADTEDTSDGAGGCAAAGGAGLPIALVGLALVRRRRRA